MAAKDRIMRPCVCLALEANKIAVEREPLHTDLRLRVPHNNVTWDVWATLIRPAKPHPHLPGINAPWVRENGRAANHGEITLDELRKVMDRLGIPADVPAEPLREVAR